MAGGSISELKMLPELSPVSSGISLQQTLKGGMLAFSAQGYICAFILLL